MNCVFYIKTELNILKLTFFNIGWWLVVQLVVPGLLVVPGQLMVPGLLVVPGQLMVPGLMVVPTDYVAFLAVVFCKFEGDRYSPSVRTGCQTAGLRSFY